jgi:inosose dehydratase
VTFGKNPRKLEWSQFLDEVVAAGYDGVELGTWGYLPTEPSLLLKELTRRNLSLAGGQLNCDFTDDNAWPAVRERTRAICDLLFEVGARRLVLLGAYGVTLHGHELDPATWALMVERIQEIARLAQEGGVLAAYHPHAGGTIESEDEIERFLADTDPGLVFLCFDTGHHAYCGGDVTGFLRHHRDRVAHLHLKNVNARVRDHVVAHGIPFSEAAQLGVMTELEAGLLDFAIIRDVLNEIGFDGWAVVEQDMSSSSSDTPSVVAARNREFLRRLNFSHSHSPNGRQTDIS